MQHNNWQCAKCGNTTFDTDQFRARSSGLGHVLDFFTQ